MPLDPELSTKTWNRYAFCRDNGHLDFVKKDDKCNRFFCGDQWDKADKSKLELVRRPALTINKIISTVSNVMGEQIFARAETSFRPRSGASSEIAEILNKVYKQISDDNQLDWKRSEMFADGIIGSRGFLDVRIAYNDNTQGEVRIENINPKNVLIDPDADQYDPDTWGEVFTTKWMTADDIAVLYSKADAELLRNRTSTSHNYNHDLTEFMRDRFGDVLPARYTGNFDESAVNRNIRVVERQHRVLDRQRHFLDTTTGDTRPIPEEFGRDTTAYFVQKYGFTVITKLVRRIKWDVVADNVRLHSDWSPYQHFTIVPYFPYFRRGRTVGMVENLIDPQEVLNKVTSQELHVINTTANSGWIVQSGALVNMTTEELEQKGAQTGLVIEVNTKDAVEKIQPNQVPTGLDRASYKAEEHIKTISGVSDSQLGQDRADVAAKAIQAKRQAGSTNLVKPMDSLTRTDYILARNILDLVQEFYTEERLGTITHDDLTGKTENFTINQPNPNPPPDVEAQEEAEATGKYATPYEAVLNDLTLGEYSVVISSVPRRETLEDSQFEQAVSLRELGVPIPDDVLVESSRLVKKKDILEKMAGNKSSPEAQALAQLQQRAQAAEVAQTEATAAQKQADAQLKQVKTQVLASTPITPPPAAPDSALAAAQAEFEAVSTQRAQEHKERMDLLAHSLREREADDNFALAQEEINQERTKTRAQEAQQQAAQAQKSVNP